MIIELIEHYAKKYLTKRTTVPAGVQEKAKAEAKRARKADRNKRLIHGGDD